jgi:hypothetical protein
MVDEVVEERQVMLALAEAERCGKLGPPEALTFPLKGWRSSIVDFCPALRKQASPITGSKIRSRDIKMERLWRSVGSESNCKRGWKRGERGD